MDVVVVDVVVVEVVVVVVVVVLGAPTIFALKNFVGLMSALILKVYPFPENSTCFAVSPPGLVGEHLILDCPNLTSL